MDQSRLVHMANQIATYFGSYPEEEAVEQTRSHIKLYWDPRMRTGLLALLAAGGEGLSPIALAAAQGLKPTPATSKTSP